MKPRLIDQAIFTVTAGRGGHGSIHFRREKYIDKGGPDGGNGGAGGSIILRATKHLSTLRFFAGKDRFEADKGRPGGKRGSNGDKAQDLILEVPVGTVVSINPAQYRLLSGRKLYGEDVDRMVKSGYKIDRVPHLNLAERWQLDNVDVANSWISVADLDHHAAEVVIAQGGRGGLGNTTYKSSTNTTPKVAQRGELGEKFTIKLELKVLADIGLVGLPNAGKSTLLSVLTSAKPEIADYPFTTISPNLGVMSTAGKSLVIADIPGLIEDAHRGKGLGTNFLRHVERCQTLLYVISPTANDLLHSEQLPQSLWQQYQTVKNEVDSYGQNLSHKQSFIVINKTDLITASTPQIKQHFTLHNTDIIFISAATTMGIDNLKQTITSLSRSLH